MHKTSPTKFREFRVFYILNGHRRIHKFHFGVQSLKELNFTSLINLEGLGRSPKGAPSETDRLE